MIIVKGHMAIPWLNCTIFDFDGHLMQSKQLRVDCTSGCYDNFYIV